MKDAWLKPDGKLIEVGESQHNDFAYEFLEKEMGFEKMMELLDKNNNCSPGEILHKRGWIKIRFYSGINGVEVSGNCISLVKPMRNTIDPPMNMEQMKIVKQICKENGTEFHKAINDKRFW